MSKSKQKKQKSNAASSTALHQPVQASTSASLTSFSASHYAHVSLALDSHTVRIFDIASGRCVNRWAAADEKNEKVKAIQWVEISSPTPEAAEAKRTKKRSRRSAAANGAEAASESPKKTETASEKVSMLALGLSDGSILILHPTNAGVFKRLNHAASSQPINSLSCCSNLLWSASVDGQIFAWSLPTTDGIGGILSGKLAGFGKDWSIISVKNATGSHDGEDEPMQGSASQKAQILIGKHNIKIIEVDIPAVASQVQDLSYTSLGSCTGHPSSIASLEWISSPQVSNLAFLSTATADRTVHLWSLKPSTKEIEASLVATFGLDSHVHKTLISSSNASNFELAAISGQGQVSIASGSFALFASPEKVNGTSKSPAKAKIVSLRPVSEIAAEGSASSDTFADLQVMEQAGHLRLARSGMKPQFDVVNYAVDGSYIEKVDVSKPSKGKGVLFQDEDEDEDMGAPAVRSRPSNATVSAQAPSAPLADFEEDLESQNINPGEIDADMTEATIADRLKSLAVQKEPSTSSKETSFLPVHTASLTSSLVQALHSSDVRLLESCLVHSKEKIIKNTVKRLPAHLVIPLVEALVERLGRSRRGYGVGVSGVHASRGKGLVQWMRAVLVLHIAHLITIPGLVNRLSALHRTIEARLELHQPLLALSGRLELVCSQIELRREAAQINQERANTTAAIEFVEGEESDDDMEEEEEEGSVEDIVLGPRQDSDDEEGSDDEDVEGLLDLEAEDSDEDGIPEEYHTESEGDASDLIDDGSESGQESSDED